MKYLSPIVLPSLAVDEGANTPIPDNNGALIWSTTAGKVLSWSAGAWRAQNPSLGLGMHYATAMVAI